MKIASLKIRNYRTLESVDLEFPSPYTAICGANDSGKTNVVRSIRALMKEKDRYGSFRFPNDESDLSVKDDFPKWSDTEPSRREIRFELTIILQKVQDTGFYQFVCKQLSIAPNDDALQLSLSVSYRLERTQPSVVVTAGETPGAPGSRPFWDASTSEVGLLGR
jgi:putative ATP-dependent endonuclease of OLD family